jgi:hypothetical protein
MTRKPALLAALLAATGVAGPACRFRPDYRPAALDSRVVPRERQAP